MERVNFLVRKYFFLVFKVGKIDPLEKILLAPFGNFLSDAHVWQLLFWL